MVINQILQKYELLIFTQIYIKKDSVIGDIEGGSYEQLIDRKINNQSTGSFQYVNESIQTQDNVINNQIQNVQESEQTSQETTTLIQHPEYAKEKLNVLQASFSLINSVIGVGLLSLPYVFKAGYVVSPIIQLIFVFTSVLSYYQLISVSDYSRHHDYLLVSQKILPKYVGIITVCMQIIAVSGAVISYNIVLKDNMYFFPDEELYKNLLLMGIVLLVIMPLSMLKSLEKLSFGSYLVILCILYVVFALIYQFVDEAKKDVLPPIEAGDAQYALESLSLTVGAYSGETKHKRPNGKKTVNYGNAMLFILYIIIGLFGYMCYGEETKPDILCNLADDNESVISNIGNISMIILLCFHVPLPVYAIRETILTNTKYKYSVVARCLVTAGICILAMILGMLLPSVDCVLDFTNSISGSYLAYFAPGLFGFKMGQQLNCKKEKGIGIYLMIFGCATCILGLYSAVVKWIVPLF